MQEQVSFDTRNAEAKRIAQKYPDRVPVICEKAARSDLPDLLKKKFLVSRAMLCGEFKHIIQRHMAQTDGALSFEQTIYLVVGNITPRTGTPMSEVYEQHRDEDGFLYIRYTAENTLGSS